MDMAQGKKYRQSIKTFRVVTQMVSAFYCDVVVQCASHTRHDYFILLLRLSVAKATIATSTAHRVLLTAPRASHGVVSVSVRTA